MPAIDLARLKTQAANVVGNFSNHMAFLYELHEMLERYSNRTMRGSQVAQRLSLPTYNTPAPVLRQLGRELVPLANTLPDKAVFLVKELWKDGKFESRLLAARLIGMIPPITALPLLAHLPTWLAMSPDKAIQIALLTDSFTRFRQETPEAFFTLLEEWLMSPQPVMQLWGLQALIPILTDPDFQDLPSVFRILRPAVQGVGPTTQLEMQACLTTLESISPIETTAYLRDLLTDGPSSILLRMMRRMLPAFSPELRITLLDILRDEAGRVLG